MQQEKTWYTEINEVRGVAIFILLLYHADFFRDNFLGYMEYLNLFAIPIFFFVSGLVLTLRYKDDLKVKSFYKRRFQYLIPAYLIWSIVTVTLVRGFNFQSFINIVTGYSEAIWFLFVLFQLYLLFPIILKICKKNFGKWLFGIVSSCVAISVILLWNSPFNSLLYRFYFNLIVFRNEFITVDIARFFWFIPFSIYFIMGVLIGLNYEQFKEKLLKYKYKIGITWISFLLVIPFIVYYLNLNYTGYFNVEGILFSISSIFFFFLIFIKKSSNFFNINGKLAVAIFLITPSIFHLLWNFYFNAGWWLFDIAFYLGGVFFCLTLILLFVFAFKLWGSKFFYFNWKFAVAIFLVLPVVLTLFLSFLIRPLTSTYDFFTLVLSLSSLPLNLKLDLILFSVCSFFIVYLIGLILTALIKKIPHYEYILTEIRN